MLFHLISFTVSLYTWLQAIYLNHERLVITKPRMFQILISSNLLNYESVIKISMVIFISSTKLRDQSLFLHVGVHMTNVHARFYAITFYYISTNFRVHCDCVFNFHSLGVQILYVVFIQMQIYDINYMSDEFSNFKTRLRRF